MMNKTLIIVFIVAFSFACNKSSQKYDIDNINYLFEEEIVLPDSFLTYDNDTVLYYPTQKICDDRISLIKLIDVSCYACITDLNNTSKFLDKISKNYRNVNLLLIIYNYNDFQYFKNFILPQIELKYPIILDPDKSFLESNKFLPEERYLKTFLVNKNKIQIIGNPNINDKIKNLYLKKIKSLDRER